MKDTEHSFTTIEMMNFDSKKKQTKTRNPNSNGLLASLIDTICMADRNTRNIL